MRKKTFGILFCSYRYFKLNITVISEPGKAKINLLYYGFENKFKL
jgi:hypothetical protein